jgi:hypothetical protein
LAGTATAQTYRTVLDAAEAACSHLQMTSAGPSSSRSYQPKCPAPSMKSTQLLGKRSPMQVALTAGTTWSSLPWTMRSGCWG